jgi:hypothetical protein
VADRDKVLVHQVAAHMASGVDRPSGESFEQTLVRFAGLNRGLGRDQATTLLPNPGDMPDGLGAEQVP